MGIVLIFRFTTGELTFAEYTTLDINRHGDDIHINATNTSQDLAFNRVFDEIMEFLGDDEVFTIGIKTEKEQATFNDMTVDYYLNAVAEVLHFGKRIVQTDEEKEQ